MYYETVEQLGAIPEGTTITIYGTDAKSVHIIEFPVEQGTYVERHHEIPLAEFTREKIRHLDIDEPAFRDLMNNVKAREYVRDTNGEIHFVYQIVVRNYGLPMIETHKLNLDKWQWYEAAMLDPREVHAIERDQLEGEEANAVDIANFMGLPEKTSR